jgi:hypothetical protein
MLRIAMRVSIFVGPGAILFEANRVDDEGISVPRANLFAEERRSGSSVCMLPSNGTRR